MNCFLLFALFFLVTSCSEHSNKPNESPKKSALPELTKSDGLLNAKLIHGWSTSQVQELQLKVAAELGLKKDVSFHDDFSINGELFSGPKMLIIPPAVFVMGCYDWDKSCFPREDQKALITIEYPFAVAVKEVSYADWALCTKAGHCESKELNSTIRDIGDLAVTYISWDEAQIYVDWLSKVTGKKYRLLSESEHEHASRSGGAGALLGNMLDCSNAKYHITTKSNNCYE